MLLTATFSQGFCGFLSTAAMASLALLRTIRSARGLLFPTMGTGRDFHQQTGKRQTRAVELNPSDPKGNTHRSRSPFLCGDNRIPTKIEKEAEVILCQLAKAPRAGAFVFGFAGGEGSTRGGMHRTGVHPSPAMGSP